MVVTFPDLGNVGRLGNQLFQIASTVGLAESRGLEPRFPQWDYAPFFSIPERFFEPFDALQIQAVDLVPEIDERERIYLQKVSLFDGVKETIRSYFAPSESALEVLAPELEVIESLSDPILSIHVRRGDILEHQEFHPVRSVQYYIDAVEQVGPVGSVAVFSDDPSWCSNILVPQLGLDVGFIGSGVIRSPIPSRYRTEGPVDWGDLFLMSRCHRHIISNSTYSWWGAYLSDDPHPIYPDNWFGQRLSHVDSSILFPDHWVKVADPTQGGV